MGTQQRFVALSLILCVLAKVASANETQLETRIVGGLPANQSSTKHQVSMRLYATELSPGQGFRCGGSLITTKTVLTAAHCMYLTVGLTTILIKPAQLLIVAGDLLLNETSPTSARRNVSKVIVHPTYDNDFHSDLSILILTQPFQISAAIEPITLTDNVVLDNTNCQVTGWGSLHYGNYPASNQLMSVTVPIVGYESCNTSYDGYITYDMICAGDVINGGIDACQGDSGGPFVCNNTLTGVVSFGFECALPDFPGVYANVSHHRQWIDENTENLASTYARMSCVVLFSLAITWLFGVGVCSS